MLAVRSISHLTESFDEANIIDKSVSDGEQNQCECEMIYPVEPDNCKKISESNDESDLALHGKRELSDEQNSTEESFSGNCNSHQRQSSIFASGSQLVSYVGRKDVMIAMFLSASIAISTIITYIHHCFYCCRERSLPENILFIANSAIDVKIYAQNDSFCNRSSSKPNFNIQNPMLNTTYRIVEGCYDEIAYYLGWSVIPTSVEWEQDLQKVSFGVLVWLVLVFYSLTNLEGCRAIWILQFIAIIFALFLYIGILLEQVIVFILVLTVTAVFLPVHYLSIEWQLNIKWWPCYVALFAQNFSLLWISFFFPMCLREIIVYAPLILTANEFLFSKVMEHCFTAHRRNQFGMSFLMAGYLITGEGIRFGSFLALYIGYKHNLKTLNELLLNIAFSIFGEVCTHSGIREVAEKWLGQWILLVSKMNSFPEVRWGISSIRQVCEIVAPASTLSLLVVFNVARNCASVYEASIINQIIFFTSKRLMIDIWEILFCYYSVEILALVLCNRIAQCTSYLEGSALGSLKFSRVCLLAVEIMFISPPVVPIFFIPVVMGYEY